MLPTKLQTIQFLNKELRDRARDRGLDTLPEQADVNMVEVAKVKVQNATSRRP